MSFPLPHPPPEHKDMCPVGDQSGELELTVYVNSNSPQENESVHAGMIEVDSLHIRSSRARNAPRWLQNGIMLCVDRDSVYN